MNQNLSKQYRVWLIWLSHFFLRRIFNIYFKVADPNHFNADTDPAFHFNADPDPAPHQKMVNYDHWSLYPQELYLHCACPQTSSALF
jgi:endo-1,4-beta-mannosidase